MQIESGFFIKVLMGIVVMLYCGIFILGYAVGVYLSSTVGSGYSLWSSVYLTITSIAFVYIMILLRKRIKTLEVEKAHE